MSSQPPNEFSDFLSKTTADEGPVSTRNIPRQKKRRHKRKKRRGQRAS